MIPIQRSKSKNPKDPKDPKVQSLLRIAFFIVVSPILMARGKTMQSGAKVRILNTTNPTRRLEITTATVESMLERLSHQKKRMLIGCHLKGLFTL